MNSPTKKLSKTAALKLAIQSGIKFSSPSKMPCYTWSLQAIDTCAGSINPKTGKLVDACSGCYATTGFYLMGSTMAPRVANKQDWKRSSWVDDMVTFLSTQSYFRWFDSGDCYSLKLAKKIYAVMLATPNCKHWLPTRMHKFSKFTQVFNDMNALPNVVVRFSSDSIKGKTIKGAYTSTIIEHADDTVGNNTTVCEAYSRNGKCKDCRTCWSKDVDVIAYPQHGQKMAKINLQLAS